MACRPRFPRGPVTRAGVLLVWASCAMSMACSLDLTDPKEDAPRDGGAAGQDGGEAGSEAGREAGADASDAAQDAPTTECIPIVASEPVPVGPFTFVSTITPNIGTSTEDDILIELFELGASQGPGTFDLSKGNESNYATCEHCFLLREDRVGFVEALRTYFPREGSVAVTAMNSPPTPQFSMQLTGVEFVQVEIDPISYLSTPVEGGACYVIQSATWDTTNRTESDCVDGDGVACEVCCRAYHAYGAYTETDATVACVCTTATCQTECASTYCSNVSTSGPACDACMANALAAFGACGPEVNAACSADEDCALLKDCYAQCP